MYGYDKNIVSGVGIIKKYTNMIEVIRQLGKFCGETYFSLAAAFKLVLIGFLDVLSSFSALFLEFIIGFHQ